MDTQWPRYQVFKQERVDRPPEDVGTVHAPDAELALLNARDIFVRRPACVSLWVLPADDIHARTAQQLREEKVQAEEADGPREEYWVFQKRTERGSHQYVGRVNASSPAQALRQAVRTFREAKVLVWWVVPARRVTRSDDADISSLFEPAKDKDYRDPAAYDTRTARGKIRQGEPGRGRSR